MTRTAVTCAHASARRTRTHSSSRSTSQSTRRSSDEISAKASEASTAVVNRSSSSTMANARCPGSWSRADQLMASVATSAADTKAPTIARRRVGLDRRLVAGGVGFSDVIAPHSGGSRRSSPPTAILAGDPGGVHAANTPTATGLAAGAANKCVVQTLAVAERRRARGPTRGEALRTQGALVSVRR